MRMHAFPCESISEAGVHYQDNGTADGCSCHTGPLALEEHHRQAVLLRGRPGESHRSGQGSRGLYELLTGSYWNFPNHNQLFHSSIMTIKIEATYYTLTSNAGVSINQLTELNCC